MLNGGINGPVNAVKSSLPKASGTWDSEDNYTQVKNNVKSGVVTQGLQVYLDSANPASYPGTGGTWYDLSGNGLNFTGDASFIAAGQGLRSGSAWSSATTGVLNTDTHTLSFYVKFNPTDTYPQAWSDNWEKLFTYAAGGSDRSPGIWRYPSQRILHWRFDPGNTEADLSPSTFGAYGQAGMFALGCWYHVCVVKNGATAIGYVNGVRIGTNAVVATKSAGTAAMILFEGYTLASAHMDFVQVYSRSLTDAEVLQNYNASKTRLNRVPMAYLVVGGGGGGGKDMGGGGGAGGYVAGSTYITPGTYSVSVGAGGYGSPAGSGGVRTDGVTETQAGHQFTVSATNGQDSYLEGTAAGIVRAKGGGYGGSSYFGYTPNQGYGAAGGSGGGASGYSDGNTGRNGASNQSSLMGYGKGNAGGTCGGQYYSGGGGGAGGAGANGTNQADGGIGIQNDILGTNYYWAGGGGGAGYSREGGNGGAGGGGAGATGARTGGSGLNPGSNTNGNGINQWTNSPGGDGGANTGGGGGGGSHYNATNKGGEGGSGSVVVRYQDFYPDLVVSPGITHSRTITGQYKVYHFTAGTGTFTLPELEMARPVEYLVVGGGGGGGSYVGGGGGGGGVVTGTLSSAANSFYTITVGAGGSGGTSGRGDNETNGGNSSIVASSISQTNVHNITALGGGRGARYADQSGYAGGSGGGHGGSQNNGARAGSATQPSSASGGLGNNGASSLANRPNDVTMGGGGGGAGTYAPNNTANYPGDAGNGVYNAITGTGYYWAGGGGGGAYNPGSGGSPARSGNGGLGGGGNGGCYASGTVGVIGTGGINAATQTAINAGAYGQGVGGAGGANTGSGGGGCGHSDQGGNGGSGIVVIRYPSTYPDLAFISAGLTYVKTNANGYTIYRFTAGTGQIAFTATSVVSDPYAQYLKLALPLQASTGVADYSAAIRGSGASYAPTAVNGASIDASTSKFYDTSLSLTPYTSLKHVAVANDSGLWLTNQDFTIEGWWYFTANNVGYQNLASHSGDTADAQNGWVLYMESNNGLNFLASSGWALNIGGTSATPATGMWHHIAVSRVSNTTRLFLNGTQIGSSTQVVNITSPSTRNLRIGDYTFFPGGERGFSGYVQDFRMYIGVGKYTGTFTPPKALRY